MCGADIVADRIFHDLLLALQVSVLRLLRDSGRQCREQSRASHCTIKLKQCWARKQPASSNRDMRQMLKSRSRQPSSILLCFRVLLMCMLSGNVGVCCLIVTFLGTGAPTLSSAVAR